MGEDMKTILRIEIADFEGGGFAWVICDDFDVSKTYEQFETLEEAESALEQLE